MMSNIFFKLFVESFRVLQYVPSIVYCPSVSWLAEVTLPLGSVSNVNISYLVLVQRLLSDSFCR